jgi:hypothetical protein
MPRRSPAGLFLCYGSAMGHISNFDVDHLIEAHGLTYFVETGTGQASSLCHMVNYFPMQVYCSCEFDENLYKAAQYCLRDALNVHIAHARSVDFLGNLLRYLPPDRPILFWLDAHFPDFVPADATSLYLPLADELRIIAELRPHRQDVIAIDDMCIYVDGDFARPLPDWLRQYCPETRGMGFIEQAFGSTHDMALRHEEGGLLLLTPR